MFFFFFFKQKTAYEMRISDWSSDVCSSDLHEGEPGRDGAPARHRQAVAAARHQCRIHRHAGLQGRGGRDTMILGLCESPLTFNAIIDWSTALNNGDMQLREIVDQIGRAHV